LIHHFTISIWLQIDPTTTNRHLMSRHLFPSLLALPLAAALVVAGPAIASAQGVGANLQAVASGIVQQTTCTQYSYES
jgi:hypothetical protein